MTTKNTVHSVRDRALKSLIPSVRTRTKIEFFVIVRREQKRFIYVIWHY